MRHFFSFRGENSCDYGLYITGSGTFGAPERDVETVEMPGRNGNLIIDNHRFKNISLSYPAFIRRNFLHNADATKAWLAKDANYARLEDTYNPDYFRMARFTGPLDFDARALNRAGETEITFDCKPQRWRKDGENPIIITGNSAGGKDVIYNDLYPSLPLIRINGSAAAPIVIHFGDYIVTVNELSGHITIDCDTQNAFRGTLNQNKNVKIPDFPVLTNGKNEIWWTDGTIDSVEITPRWWTI